MSKALLILAALGLLAAPSGRTHPNFTGTWKLNTAKSEFGPLPAPSSRTDRISHEDPSLKIAVTQEGAQGQFRYELTYTTDGKVSSNEIRGNPIKSRLHWEGERLWVDTRGRIRGNDVTIRDQWALAGEVLTISRHLASSMGETDQKLVFEKQ